LHILSFVGCWKFREEEKARKESERQKKKRPKK